VRRSTRLLLTLAAAALTAGGIALVTGADDDGDAVARTVPNRAFTSAADPRRPAVLWAVGDTDATRGGRALGRRVAAADPDRFLYLGDVYDKGLPREFATRYDPIYGKLADRTAPTPGNHEWPARGRGYDAYWRKATGEPTPHWYGFDAGGWRIVSLNSEAATGPGSEQLDWLRREVRRPGVGTCRLAVWHRPLESAGPHGDHPSVRPFHDTLRGHATISLHGHDHNSQRLRPLGGIQAYVVGAGGRTPLYDVDHEDERVRFGDDYHFAALRIVLRPGTARLDFVTAAGEVLDRTTVRCAPS
jgi:hypothetical protein